MKLRDLFAARAAGAALTAGLILGAALPAHADPSGHPKISTSRSLTCDPLAPLGVIAGLGGLYGAIGLLPLRRRAKGAWLRVAAGGALVTALVNPEIRHEQREHMPTEVAIVVDESGSQSLGGRTAQTAAMRDALLARLAKIDGIAPRVIEARAPDGTALFGALDSLSDTPPDRLGAVIMLTDGLADDAAAAPDVLPAGVPLHVLLSGREGETDRKIVIDRASRFGLVGTNGKIAFHVADDGAPVAGMAHVTVSRDGKPVGGVDVTPGAASEIAVALSHPGDNLVTLSVDPLPGELTAINNRAALSIEGVREAVNVLMISGAPDAAMPMLRSLFKSDPDARLVNFSVLRPPEKEDATPLRELSLIPFPANEVFGEKLDKFDLIVFDDYSADGFISNAYLAGIAARVRAGGALMIMSGPELAGAGSLYKTPLAAVMPVVPSGAVDAAPFVPKVTPPGERHPVTRDLDGGRPDDPPWGRWLRMMPGAATGGRTLMTGDGKPLLVLGQPGQGRVAMLDSDEAWRWAHGFDGGGPAAELLRRMARWLMTDPAMEEEALTLRQSGDRIVAERQTMADKAAPVTFHTPAGQVETVEAKEVAPGRWRADIPAGAYGLYTAREDGAGGKSLEAVVNAGPDSPHEFADTISTAVRLAPDVAAAGGHIGRMMDRNGALSVPGIVLRGAHDASGGFSGADWIGIRKTEVMKTDSVGRAPLLPPWLGLLLTGGLIAGAWYGESEKTLFRRKADSAPPAEKGPS